jgi:hypothetical protein
VWIQEDSLGFCVGNRKTANGSRQLKIGGFSVETSTSGNFEISQLGEGFCAVADGVLLLGITCCTAEAEG